MIFLTIVSFIVNLVLVAWLCIAVPTSVLYAKRLHHRGSWWALYVLGLHAACAPLYFRMRQQPGVFFALSRPLRMAYQFLALPAGADIPLSAKIGRGLTMGHTAGVVLTHLATIGDYCVITPGVVLAGDGLGGAPVIGRNVYIGANAVIVGSVLVGDSAPIGAGAIVIRDVPSRALVVGNPGAVVKQNYRRSFHDYAKEAGCE